MSGHPRSLRVARPGFSRVDGIGVLQWHGDILRSGATIRLHCYYDAYCVCSDFKDPPRE
jgi:hypothetical protein